MIKNVNKLEMKKFLDKMPLRGKYHIVHKAADGNVIDEETIDNIVVNEGKDYILNAAINGSATVISAWYFAPWGAAHTPAATDTYAIPGYTEETAYTVSGSAVRGEWAVGASSGQSVTNAVATTITATAAITLYGIGVVGGGTAASTQGDTAGGGILLSNAAFAASKTLAIDETLDITYTLSA